MINAGTFDVGCGVGEVSGLCKGRLRRWRILNSRMGCESARKVQGVLRSRMIDPGVQYIRGTWDGPRCDENSIATDGGSIVVFLLDEGGMYFFVYISVHTTLSATSPRAQISSSNWRWQVKMDRWMKCKRKRKSEEKRQEWKCNRAGNKELQERISHIKSQ